MVIAIALWIAFCYAIAAFFIKHDESLRDGDTIGLAMVFLFSPVVITFITAVSCVILPIMSIGLLLKGEFNKEGWKKAFKE